MGKTLRPGFDVAMVTPTLKEVEATLDQVLAAWGFELVSLRFRSQGRKGTLQVVIDKPGGVSLDDCQRAHERIGDYLDAVDAIPTAYILEVTSPGVDRLLTKDRHFEENLGKEVSLKLSEKFEGRHQFRGTLRAYDAETVTLGTENEVYGVPRHLVDEARLVYRWE